MRVRGKSRHPRHLFLVSTGDRASPAIAFLGPAFGDQDSLQGVKMNLQNKTKQDKSPTAYMLFQRLGDMECRC